MFPAYQYGQQPPPAAPSHPPYHSQSTVPAGPSRPRQNSNAMDIYAVTDREPPKREHQAGPAGWSSNGSPAAVAPIYKYVLGSNTPRVNTGGRAARLLMCNFFQGTPSRT